MGNPHHDSRGRFSSGGGGGRSGHSPAQRIAFAHIGPASSTSNADMAHAVVEKFATGKSAVKSTSGASASASSASKAAAKSSSSNGGERLASMKEMAKTNQKMARMRRAQLRKTYQAQGKPLPPGLR
jgi:hypothetical protein